MKRIALLLLAACASSSRVPLARFVNAPVVEVVNDRGDVPKPPEERIFLESVYHYDGLVQRRMTRAMELHPPTRALGINALDEVPDSTWFTNRIGTRDLTPEQLAAGPNAIGSPEEHKPWTIVSTKTGGAEIGFIIKDARGEKFVLKFDTQKFPEQETGAHTIVEHILWACGYNVTDDYIVHFRDEDLLLGKDAYVKDSATSPKRPLDRAELARRLSMIQRDPDGSVRALASYWLAGKPLGGHPAEGVRDDDPNDRIPHELRRDLRGLYVFAAWLDHGDIQESNFADVWTQDPADEHRHYVVHYLLDFGKSLGVFATTGADPRRGYEYWFDPAAVLRSLVTLGLWHRPWEGRDLAPSPGAGAYDANFDPGDWRPTSAAYIPFTTRDRYDGFWAAKIMMRFTRAQLHAIVETAQYRDRRTTEYLTNMLVARQRKTGAYWFSRVNPLDRFTMKDDAVCFDDLALRHGFTAEPTTYTVATFDRHGQPIGSLDVPATGDRTCTQHLTLASAPDAYTIVELTTRRSAFAGTTLVHIARDPASGALRIIGIWRP
jgi:hypothetical protein